MTTPALVQSPVIHIAPSRAWAPLRLGELWAYRELLYFLVWRDIKVRYKQTALGAAWAVIQPLLTMVVFSVFFGRLANIPSDGVPYPVFAFCRAGAVAALRLRADASRATASSRNQRPDHQGVLSAAGDADGGGRASGWSTSPSPSSCCWR